MSIFMLGFIQTDDGRIRLISALFLFGFFLVEIPVQIVWGELRGRAGCRHVELGCPENRINDDSPEIFIAPVLVEMPTGKSKSTGTVRTFAGPGNMLKLASGYSGTDGRVAAMGAVGTR